MQSFQSLLDARCGTNGRNPCPAGSEGSPPLPCSWEENTPLLPQGSMGQGEERVSSLRGWGDVPMRDFLEQPPGHLDMEAKSRLK